ncbi:MAG: hypothetical protein AB1529_01400 [Candidatus Micrarchaeota archaeon]
MRKNALLLLALIGMASAAYVYGDIYQQDLQKLNRTAIRIEGRFTYQLVTDKANYSIFLPEGDYAISASSSDSGAGELRSLEKVSVGPEDQRVDLVLRPALRAEYALFLLALCAIAVIFLWSSRRWGKAAGQENGRKPERASQEPVAEQKFELDEDAKSVLRVLDGMEGRATQKEIKETLKFSDAKLSLILTELEQTGHVRKFKRGRANIIRKLK